MSCDDEMFAVASYGCGPTGDWIRPVNVGGVTISSGSSPSLSPRVSPTISIVGDEIAVADVPPLMTPAEARCLGDRLMKVADIVDPPGPATRAVPR